MLEDYGALLSLHDTTMPTHHRLLPLLLPLRIPHVANIVPIGHQVLPEPDVLGLYRILVDIRQPEDQERTEEAQGTGDVEGVLSAVQRCTTAVRLDDREHVATNQTADFAGGGSDGVVLAADAGGAGLRGDEADVVTWSCTSKRGRLASLV